MKRLKCIIVEDQLPAQRILLSYIKEVPNLELIGTFVDPLKAIPVLEENQIDVLFLDVHLPKLTGIAFLKSLEKKPAVILTTAFTEYALEGFELDVVDYLLKPFSFERFLKSVSKIKRLIGNKTAIVHQQYIFVRTKGMIHKVKIEDILFIEAKGDFVLIHIRDNRLTANSTLQDMLDRLENHFTRCHKSFIVNINAIHKIVGNRINIGTLEVPIGRTYRERLMKKLSTI